MGLAEDIRWMHQRYPSSWLVAWSRVMTIRSTRVRNYLRMDAADRRRRYPWLYRDRSRKRRAADRDSPNLGVN